MSENIGKKKLANKKKWKTEERRVCRNNGKSYTTFKGKQRERISFTPVRKCCMKMCTHNIAIESVSEEAGSLSHVVEDGTCDDSDDS